MNYDDLEIEHIQNYFQDRFDFQETSEVNFPSDRQRLSIVGATGSGKTHAAMWHLSRRDYDQKPWIIYDFKFDELINEVEGTFELGVTDPIPDHPGIYIVHPHPGQADEVEAQMWKIWEHEHVGVYIDEGYMIGANSKAFRALLTQGRSKYIPMIILSQRPVRLDWFVFSESNFFQVFRLQHRKDLENVNQFIPFNLEKRLPEFHSYYYDVGENKLNVLRPAPDENAILDTFETRLRKLKKVV